MTRLSDLLSQALGNPEVLKAARATRALRQWPSVVGPALAAKSRPGRYDRGTVWVEADSSTWAMEVRMRREAILERLNAAADERSLFRDLRVTVAAPTALDADAARML
jgi:predicted nucleic acid-binding Zn ribbon protein